MHSGNKIIDKFDFLILAISIPLLIYSALNDLSFSISNVNYNSKIGSFTADYGEIPGYLLILISFIILPHRLANEVWVEEKFNSHNLYAMFFTFLWFLPSFLIAIHFSNRIDVQFVLTILIPIPFIFLYRKYEEKITSQIVEASKIVIKFTFIIPVIAVQLIKLFWGRIRFRNLDTNFELFTAWYLPQGYTGNLSFPSGHSAMAWLILTGYFYLNNPRKKLIFLLVAVFWGIIVSYGRIVIGAHFLSDVTFSSMISLLLFNYYRKQNLTTHT